MGFVSTFSAGLVMASRYWRELLILVLAGLEMGLVAVIVFPSRNEKNPPLGMFFLGGGWVLLSLLSLLLSILKIFSFYSIFLLMAVGFLLILFKGSWRTYLPGLISVKILIPLLIWVFFLILYLGYLEPLWLPPHHDSPFHLQFTRDFLTAGGQGLRLFPRLWRSYYHLGFHGITAWMAALKGGLHPLDLALMGQFFLALLPVTIYTLITSITGKKTAGLISAVVAGIGWPMPLQAADWGKYPLILGLALFPVVIGLIFHYREDLKGKKLIITLLMMVGLVWIHSRFVIILLIFALVYFIVYRWKVGGMSTLLLGIFITGLILFAPSRIGLAHYSGVYIYPTVGILLFAAFGLIKQRNNTLLWVCFIFLFYLASQVALPAFFHKYSAWLIDPGFINPAFALPLAILAGLGFSSWMENKTPLYSTAMVVVLLGLLFWNAEEELSFQPREATNFSSLDDLVVLQWIEDQLPAEGIFFISGQRRLGDWEGQDAGIWITPLKGWKTNYQAGSTEWCNPAVQEKICREHQMEWPLYVYQGQMENSFSQPPIGLCQGVEPVVSFPRARVYQLVCE